MPEAMREGGTYVLVDEQGQKIRFTYQGRNAENDMLRLEIDNEVREYSDLTSLANGHYSALLDVESLQ